MGDSTADLQPDWLALTDDERCQHVWEDGERCLRREDAVFCGRLLCPLHYEEATAVWLVGVDHDGRRVWRQGPALGWAGGRSWAVTAAARTVAGRSNGYPRSGRGRKSCSAVTAGR